VVPGEWIIEDCRVRADGCIHRRRDQREHQRRDPGVDDLGYRHDSDGDRRPRAGRGHHVPGSSGSGRGDCRHRGRQRVGVAAAQRSSAAAGYLSALGCATDHGWWTTPRTAWSPFHRASTTPGGLPAPDESPSLFVAVGRGGTRMAPRWAGVEACAGRVRSSSSVRRRQCVGQPRVTVCGRRPRRRPGSPDAAGRIAGTRRESPRSGRSTPSRRPCRRRRLCAPWPTA